MGPSVLAVIPTYDEAENIDLVLRSLRRVAPDVDILVVDDGSPDGTGMLARELGCELGGITVLERAVKGGLGSAYRAGFAYGLDHGYDVLVEMDADLSHDPSDVNRLLGAIEDGADLAVGSRYVAGGATPGWPPSRRRLSSAGNAYVRATLGLGTRDATSGFRAYRSTLLRTIDAVGSHATGYGFQVELTHRAAGVGARIAEVPIVFRDRVRGSSKMSLAIMVEALGLVTAWAIRERVLHLRRWHPDLALSDPAMRVRVSSH